LAHTRLYLCSQGIAVRASSHVVMGYTQPVELWQEVNHGQTIVSPHVPLQGPLPPQPRCKFATVGAPTQAAVHVGRPSVSATPATLAAAPVRPPQPQHLQPAAVFAAAQPFAGPLPVPRALVTPTAGALGAEHSLPRMSVASGSVDRPLALWDTSEVCKWAEEQLQLPPEVVDILREEEVNGLVASTLTETDMSRIGISKFGWRRRLFLGIADMIRSAICPQIHLLPGDGPMDQRLLVSPPSIAVAESSRAAASARTVDSDLHPLSLQRTSHVVQPASAGETVLPQAEDSRLGGSILSSHGSGRPHEGQSSPSVGLGTAGGGDTAMAEDVVGDGQRSEVAAMPSAEEKPGREEKEGKDGKEEEKTKEEKEEEEEREVKEEKEDEEGAAQPAPEHKNTHDSDLEAMLYGFCDPFELSAMGKQTSKERPAETKLAENTAAADALLYDL